MPLFIDQHPGSYLVPFVNSILGDPVTLASGNHTRGMLAWEDEIQSPGNSLRARVRQPILTLLATEVIKQNDEVTVAGTKYTVVNILPSSSGLMECLLSGGKS